MKDFFRPEVLRRRRFDGVGSILVVRPLSLTLLTTVVLVAAIALVAWLSIGTYTRKVRVEGLLQVDAAGRLQAELFAGAGTRRSLRDGQSVTLRFPALVRDLGRPVTGSITAVPAAPITAREAPALATAFASRAAREPVYRVVVRLDALSGVPAGGLAVGTVVEANVRVERRRLIAWMFAQSGSAAGPV